MTKLILNRRIKYIDYPKCEFKKNIDLFVVVDADVVDADVVDANVVATVKC